MGARSVERSDGRAFIDWALVLPHHKLVYVEVPKAACTKIRTLLILLHRGGDDAELARFLHEVKPSPYYHWEFGVLDNRGLPPGRMEALLHAPDHVTFSFVRNPYTRVWSAYLDKIRRAPERGNAYYARVARRVRATHEWRRSDPAEWAARAFAAFDALGSRRSDSVTRPRRVSVAADGDYETIKGRIEEQYGRRPPRGLGLRLGDALKARLPGYPRLDDIDLSRAPVSFEEFVDFVCRRPDATMDVHWRPQTVCLGMDVYDYDFIGRVESFSKDMQALLTLIGAPEGLFRHVPGKMNATNRAAQPPIWTDALAERIYERYRADFEAFGYDRLSYLS